MSTSLSEQPQQSLSPIAAPAESDSPTMVDQLIGIIRDQQGMQPHEVVTPEDTLAQVLGIDSLDALELFMALEDVVDRDLSAIQDAARAQWKSLTVRDLAKILVSP